MKLRAAQYVFATGWTAVVVASAWLNYTNWRAHVLDMAEESAAAFVDQVMLTRYWNAYHGRVYVPVTDQTRPNRYLEVADRDIVGSDGTRLTMVNPAFMTRQISEMTDARSYVRFHLTSNNPLRPGNEPTSAENEVLERFKIDPAPVSQLLETSDGEVFFYMEPVFTEMPCLRCHGDQGYQLGDVRGGISVSMPLTLSNMPTVVLASHAGLFAVGLTGIFVFFRSLRSNFDIIRHHARHDPLTGLLNRRSIELLLDREIQRSRRQSSPLSVMALDVDNFKHINDCFGHAAGDQALRDLAHFLDSHTRSGVDAVGRLGGDEFVVVMADTCYEAGRTTAERLRAAVEQHRLAVPDGRHFGFTVSIGLVERSDAEHTSDGLLDRADRALYKGKESGRNQVGTA